MIIFRSFKVFQLELVVLLQGPEHAQVSKVIILAYVDLPAYFRSEVQACILCTNSNDKGQ